MSAVTTPGRHAHHDCGCGGPLLAGLGALLTVPARPRARPRPEPPTGTTVIRGATVLPVDDAFSEAEAIAFTGDRIVAVGSEDDVRAATGDSATVLDRTGTVILPGFVEPHAPDGPDAMHPQRGHPRAVARTRRRVERG